MSFKYTYWPNKLENTILDIIRRNENSSSGEIHQALQDKASLATIKRHLSNLTEAGYLDISGSGRSTRYYLSVPAKVLSPVDIDAYFSQEQDNRVINSSFNFDLLNIWLIDLEIFSPKEQLFLNELQAQFEKNTATLDAEQFKSEFERLAIDLSWKSSQIEGNTYSLLETERLLKEQKTAAGKQRDEATMLLNHKAALNFLLAEPKYLNPLSIKSIEDIHSMLMKDLPVGRNIRNRRVGITGTNYRPLENEFQIGEALLNMCKLINSRVSPFEKSLLAMLTISYIQPFEDGNKRTARIAGNALLMAFKHCPLSFRTVDAMDFKKAMLIFYEQNNLSPFKQIFIDQYEFAVKTYF